MDEKDKYLILSEEIQSKNEDKALLEQSAVIINLYYEDTVEVYLSYIDNVPKEMDIYIFSSKASVCEKVEVYKEKTGRKNLYTEIKENRGRDVSTLLVSAKDVIKQYTYICFLHDKKAHAKHLEKDVAAWVKGLWINMLGSYGYICNVLHSFRNNEALGLMLPPKPMGQYSTTLRNCWHKNFENTVELAKILGIKTDISKNDSPISIGTVFWARTAALKKLFDYNWMYEDFVEEPMPYDGTISHAIERIFPYIVEDAGYKTVTVVTSAFAQSQLCYMQSVIEKTYDILNEEMGIGCIDSLEKFSDEYRRLCAFCERNDNVYIYGAAETALQCIRMLKLRGYIPKGLVVSQKSKIKELEGLSVYPFEEVADKQNIAVVVAVSWKYINEIELNLRKNGITNYIVLGEINL